MLIDNRYIWVYWKTNETSYAYANRKVLVEPPRKIGSSISSVSKVLSKTEEQKEIMPDVINISPNSEKWNELLSNYWNSLSYEIPQSGKKLQIGFVYDINNSNKRKYINSINDGIKSESKKLKTDEDLKSYIDDKIKNANIQFNKTILEANRMSDLRRKSELIKSAYTMKYTSIISAESERYKVGTPINAAQYMLYRYCLVYRDVANEFSLVNKSSNIRLYLHSEEDIKKYKELKYKAEHDRMTAYLKAIKDVSDVENILYAMKFGDIIPDDDVDKYTLLDAKSKSDTDKFLKIANSKNLKTLGLIEKYIKYGIINRLEGSEIVVDGTDSSLVLGNSTNEIVSWFNNDVNKEKVNEYAIRFKNLNN